jgi:hypothetical protein
MTSCPHDCRHHSPADLLPWADPYIARLFADHPTRQCAGTHTGQRCLPTNQAEGEGGVPWGEAFSALVTDLDGHAGNDEKAERRGGKCSMAGVWSQVVVLLALRC